MFFLDRPFARRRNPGFVVLLATKAGQRPGEISWDWLKSMRVWEPAIRIIVRNHSGNCPGHNLVTYFVSMDRKTDSAGKDEEKADMSYPIDQDSLKAGARDQRIFQRSKLIAAKQF